MTRMRIIFLIALAAVLPGLTNGISADSFSDGRLLDKTLRIDYIFTGSDKDCDIAVAELLSAHGWYGRRTNLKEVPLRGNGQLTMTDKATGDTLYRMSFCTLFQEWQATEEATRVRRSFENVFLVPMPAAPAEITVQLYDFYENVAAKLTHPVDPKDILIRPVGGKPQTRMLLDSGDSKDKIDIAILAEGYTEGEMDIFFKDAESTVENLLGVEMEHYVLINVNAFTKIIDAIGGVDINVEKRMYYEDPWDDNGGLVINLYPGQQHMDGKTAITYVRYRDEEGDIGRIARQQKFMQAVMDKLTSPAIIPRIPAIISEVVDCIDTDLSVKQMIEFMSALKDAQSRGLQTEMLPGKPMYIGGISYWLPDLSKLRTTIANTLDVEISSSLRSATEREMLEYESSIPDDAQEIPLNETTRRQLGLDKDKEEDGSKDKDSRKTSKSEDTDGEKESDSYLSDPYAEDGDPRHGRAAHPASDSTDSSAHHTPASLPEPSAPAPSPTVPSAGKTAN